MRRLIHRILAGAAALPLALGVVSVTTADSATAVTVHPDTCTHPTAHLLDGTTGRTTMLSVPVRSGPWAACDVTTTINGGNQPFHYWCYVLNGNGFKWTFGTFGVSQSKGWVLASNLSNGGSTIHC